MNAGEPTDLQTTGADHPIETAIRAFQSGNLKFARDQCLARLAENSNDASAQHLLSAIYLQTGQADTAHQYAVQAVLNAPQIAEHHNGLGLALQALQNFTDSEAAFEEAIALEPEVADFHCNKASVLIDQLFFEKALEALETALRIDAHHTNSLANKALILQKLGRTAEGMACLDRAARLNPESLEISHNRLMMLNYSQNHAPSDVFEHTKTYWHLREKAAPAIAPTHHAKQPALAGKEPIHIGYVSSDFYSHPVGRILLPILESTDQDAFRVFLYANNTEDDHVSEGMRNNGCEWRPIHALSDDQAAALILNDGIDILVDLSGHTDGNRLGVFRHKPAPIQMTWLGYVASTGLKEIDYIIADDFVLPDEDEPCFSEAPLRLPYSHLCYRPPIDINRPKRSPNQFGCSTVFASFNNVPKINENVVETWAKILIATPDSKLLMKSPALSNNSVSNSLSGLFSSFGVPSDRLIFVGKTSLQDHISFFGCVDIALDPFPYGGMMTTLETLWLGVPVVTYAGNSWASRVSASVLTAAGLPDLVANTLEDYIETAVALANNKIELEAHHKNTKILLESSPLCDIKRFTKCLEHLYRGAWQSYCLSQPAN